MNLLSKLNSNSKVKSIEPREIFMTLPAKAPGYGYPRDVQSEVWKKWFELRNQKNVILKMNTGSGKTVVGLVMLQSCLNEDKGPAIYVVPDNYLVKQVIEEAKKLGISAKRKIKYTLLQKGINENIIENELEKLDNNELKNAAYEMEIGRASCRERV